MYNYEPILYHPSAQKNVSFDLNMKNTANHIGASSLIDRFRNRNERDYRSRALKFYTQFIEKGALCYDVGANIGKKTEIFLELGARVLAIEPQKVCMARLFKEYGRNLDVILIDEAVGHEPGYGQLTVCAQEPTISTMSNQWKDRGRFSSYYHSSSCEQVSMTTLERLIDTYGRPRFCKIDVEGFEESVLRGLSSPIPYLSFEFTKEFLLNCKACIDYLLTIGPARFNCSFGDNMNLIFEEWTDPESVYRKLHACDDTLLWGDIYVRFEHPEKRTSIIPREGSKPRLNASPDIRDLIKEAVDKHGSETGFLEFMPVHRYNTDIFAATGQYDWFSGQLLYCLVRYLQPDRILEISTASGYSTMFMALALRKNGSGIIDTCELDPNLAKKAMDLFARHELQGYVNLYVGDAQKVLGKKTADYDIHFLDSLHTEAFARWFIETHVMTANRPDALFHMHDILPANADIRFLDPAKKHEETSGRILASIAGRIFGNRQNKRLSDPAADGYATEHTAYKELWTSEAVLGYRLAELIDKRDQVFLHDIAGDYPQLEPRKYDLLATGRKNSSGMPMEWNESWWCKASALQNAYRRLGSPKK